MQYNYDITHIIIITNAIPAVKWIFDLSVHLYQLHSIVISKDLRCFFKRNPNNAITFWNCSDSIKWLLYLLVDKESKCIKIVSIFLSKMSQEFSRKEECNTIFKQQQIYFQALEYKRRNFLELNNNDYQSICPTYSKNSAWLKHFSLSNSMCACIIRLIMNHISIGKYRLRFFSKEFFTYTYEEYSIKTRRYILFDCICYKKSWNPKRESLKDILTFLEFNPGAFCFQDSVNQD